MSTEAIEGPKLVSVRASQVVLKAADPNKKRFKQTVKILDDGTLLIDADNKVAKSATP